MFAEEDQCDIPKAVLGFFRELLDPIDVVENVFRHRAVLLHALIPLSFVVLGDRTFQILRHRLQRSYFYIRLVFCRKLFDLGRQVDHPGVQTSTQGRLFCLQNV